MKLSPKVRHHVFFSETQCIKALYKFICLLLLFLTRTCLAEDYSAWRLFLVLYWHHRVATSSCRGHVDDHWRQSLFCCCTANLEQATDGAETAVIDGLVSSWSEIFCLILSTGTKIRIDSVMRPRSSSRGRNTSASVTVTVTNATGCRVAVHDGDYWPGGGRGDGRWPWNCRDQSPSFVQRRHWTQRLVAWPQSSDQMYVQLLTIYRIIVCVT